MKSFFNTIAVFILMTGAAMAQNTVLVTNTQASGAGSLRQAITTANANAGIQKIEFSIPSSDAGFNAASGVFTINICCNELPAITRRGLVVDGWSQMMNQGTQNPASIGSGTSVGSPANGNAPIIKVPEIRIVGAENITRGLAISAKGVHIKGLGISGFGSAFANNHGNIILTSGADSAKIEYCVLGSENHILAEASAKTKGNNLAAFDTKFGILQHNIIAYAGAMGAFFNYQNENWVIDNNEFLRNATSNNICDGLDIALMAKNFTVENNLFHFNGGNGLDFHNTTGGHTVRFNTMINNGQLRVENSGIRVYGKNSVFHNNRIHSNHGAGVLMTTDATENYLHSNSFQNNGNLSVNNTAITNSIGINLNAPGENNLRGTAPFYTLNDLDDIDLGGNRLANFPVITQAYINQGELVVKGFARPGAQVELYKAHFFTQAVFPQGVESFGTFTEGSAQDLDNGTGAYGPAEVNGQLVGEDNTHRFEFRLPAPAGLTVSDRITALATVNNNTSEFGNAAVLQSAPLDLVPLLECVYINAQGQYVALFGYENFTAAEICIPTGANNNLVGATVSLPIYFSAGRHSNAFSAVIPANGNLTWNLNGQTLVVDEFAALCPVDLGVNISASNSTPKKGENTTITLTLQNFNCQVPATGVMIQISLPDSLAFVNHNAQAGSYNGVNHIWEVPVIEACSTLTLTLTVTAHGAGLVQAEIVNSNQPDNHTANNSSSTNISNDTTSGSYDGGIESHGGMAAAISKRNMKRVVEGRHRIYDNISALPTMADEASMLAARGTFALSDLFPTQGREGSQAKVVSPRDLYGITNALDIYGVDYFKNENHRVASILGIETPAGEVYEHTKVVCDRLNGASILDIKHVQVAGMPFIMTYFLQANGDVDYNISFVAYQNENGSFEIDNRWNLSEYSPKANQRVFNLQVWTLSPSLTIQVVEDILALLNNEGAVSFQNRAPAVIPTVYVVSGNYNNGQMTLKLNNSVAANELTLVGSLTTTETANRENFYHSPAISQAVASEVVVAMGSLFDAGFTITNNASGGADQLYLADGMWGMDYEQGGLMDASFNVTEQEDAIEEGILLARGAHGGGVVREYFSIYRTLRAGANNPANLSEFNALSFEASSTKEIEVMVTLAKKGIAVWKNQFRTTVTLSPVNGQYTLSFDAFASALQQEFDAQDIIAVVFTVTNLAANHSGVSLQVKNLHFHKSAQQADANVQKLNQEGITAYPNPVVASTNIGFEMEFEANATVEVYNMVGQKIEVIASETFAKGYNEVKWEPGSNIKSGFYTIRITTGRNHKSLTVIRQ